MCPKSKPTETVLHRLELQTAERDALNALVSQGQMIATSQTVENATDAISNVFKPFFGSGDEGLLLTFIATSLLDELIIPDDNIFDVLISDTGKTVLAKTGFSIWSLLNPTVTLTPTEQTKVSRKWSEFTSEQKKEMRPYAMALSRSLKVTKYITGAYLGAKVGTDILDAFVPG